MATPDDATQSQPRQLIFTVTITLAEPINPDSEKPGASPASKASIEAMPMVEVEEADKDCPVCLEEFAVDAMAREMPCKHVFHSACIERWLNVRASCPVCRFLMPVEAETCAGDETAPDAEGLVPGFMMDLLAFMEMRAMLVGSDPDSGRQQGDSGAGDDESTQDMDCS